MTTSRPRSSPMISMMSRVIDLVDRERRAEQEEALDDVVGRHLERVGELADGHALGDRDRVAADGQVGVGRSLVVRGFLGVGADRLLVLLLLAAALDRRRRRPPPCLVEHLLALQLLGLDGHLAVALLFVLVELGRLLGLEAGALGCDGGLEARTSRGGGSRRRLGDGRPSRPSGSSRPSWCALPRRGSATTGAGSATTTTGRLFADDDGTTGVLLGLQTRGLLVASAVLLVAAAALLLLGLAARFLVGLAGGLVGGLLLRGLGGLVLGRSSSMRDLALGDLRAERLADLVHVRLDQRRRVVLGRDLQLLEPVEQLLA